MTTLDLTNYDDGLSIQFIGPPGLISVDTLIETLAGFSDAIAAIGDIVDESVEVYVDSLVPGSVKIGVKVRKKKGIITPGAVTTLVGIPLIVNLFSSYLYDQMKPQEKCTVEFTDDNKVITRGATCETIMPRGAYELMPRVQMDPKVASGVRKALQAVKKDKAVEGVGLAKTHADKPDVYVERAHFDNAIKRLANYRLDYAPRAHAGDAVPETRIQVERTNLVIVKAWLQRGRRKWRFNWRNIAISAAIGDADFFDRLAARDVALHQGDALDADLSILQRFVPEANVWQNVSYTVSRVYTVKLGETQTTIDFTTARQIEPPTEPKH